MSDLEVKNRISEKAREHFLAFGFSKVTMDEIATELGMSKKTLYAYFPSKEGLLQASILQMQQETSRKIETLVDDQTMEFGEKLGRLVAIVHAHHSKLGPHFLTDLQRNAPEAWKCCDDFQRERMRANTAAMVREGMQKGVFRRNFNEDFLVLLLVVTMRSMMKPEILVNLPLSASEVFQNIVSIFLGGILTDEARAKHFPGMPEFPEFASEHQMD